MSPLSKNSLQSSNSGVRSENTISWSAPEYEHGEKTGDWFFAVAIVTASLAVAAVLFGNILLAALIVVGAFALVANAVRKPGNVTITISDNGIIFGKKLYTYKELRSFTIVPHADSNRLTLTTEKFTTPHLTVTVPNEIKERVQRELAEHLPESEAGEPISHALLEKLGF